MAGGRVKCQTAAVPAHRDIAAFEDRALRYEEGWRGRMHHDIADRTAVLAARVGPAPRRVLDIGFTSIAWHDLYAVIIKAVTATA